MKSPNAMMIVVLSVFSFAVCMAVGCGPVAGGGAEPAPDALRVTYYYLPG